MNNRYRTSFIKLFIILMLLILMITVGLIETNSNKDYVTTINKEQINLTDYTLKQSKYNAKINILHNIEQQRKEDRENKLNTLQSVTGWSQETAEYFMQEAERYNVSMFEEALPIIAIETGHTYEFDVTNTNTNNTVDRGLFQINDTTYPYIVDGLKSEGREFDSWSRYNPEFNITGGLYWISILKENYGLEGHRMFTSYNRGVYGAEQYYQVNNTYKTTYSKKAKELAIKYKNKLEND